LATALKIVEEEEKSLHDRSSNMRSCKLFVLFLSLYLLFSCTLFHSQHFGWVNSHKGFQLPFMKKNLTKPYILETPLLNQNHGSARHADFRGEGHGIEATQLGRAFSGIM
jgi:hypothetical protein